MDNRNNIKYIYAYNNIDFIIYKIIEDKLEIIHSSIKYIDKRMRFYNDQIEHFNRYSIKYELWSELDYHKYFISKI
jgi:hypothetical protein